MKFQLVIAAILAFATQTTLSASELERFLEVSEACKAADEALYATPAIAAATEEVAKEFEEVLAKNEANDDGFCSVTNTSVLCTDIDFDQVTPAQEKFIEECYKVDGAQAYKANLAVECTGDVSVKASFSNLAGCFAKECTEDELKSEAKATAKDIQKALVLLAGEFESDCTTTVSTATVVANPNGDSTSAGSMMTGATVAGVSALFAAVLGMW